MAAPAPAPRDRALQSRVCTACTPPTLKPPRDFPLPTERPEAPGTFRVSTTCLECRARYMRESRDATADNERRRLVAKEIAR